MQKPRRDSCLWMLTLTWLPPQTTQQAAGEMQLFPHYTKHNPPNHITLLPTGKLLFLLGTRPCDY